MNQLMTYAVPNLDDVPREKLRPNSLIVALTQVRRVSN